MAGLVRDQVERGWSVTVACPFESQLREFALSSSATFVSWSATRAPGLSSFAEVLRLDRVVRHVNPQIVHLHSAKAGLAGRLALRGRRPTIFQPHAWSFEAAGPAAWAVAFWERFAARWVDLVVCVSADERKRGERAGVRARYALAPNGVDLRNYTPATEDERQQSRGRLGLASGPLALMIGRFQRQKGADVLLGAWPAVRRLAPDARLALVGEGPDRQGLQARATPGVEFYGNQDDVKDWIAAADVVAIPSRWEAGLTLVAMEAMARARPVVATDTAGMREGLGDQAGEVVPIGDVAALAAALARRLIDPSLAASEGWAARRRVEKDYDLRATTARTAGLYELALTRRAGR